MKKVLLIAAMAVSSVSFAQINFGAQIGGNIANVKIDPSFVSPTSKFGITLGAVAEIPVSGQIFFRPEFNFVQKGAKVSSSESEPGFSATYTEKWTMSYLELPLNFVYNVNAGSGNLFFGAGPSLGFGIGGKISTTSTLTVDGETTTESSSTSIKFDGNKNATDNNAHLKAIDFGFGLLAGYKMSNNLSFSLGYNMGLSDIDVEDLSTSKNKGFAIKVGYMFSGGKK